MTFTTDRLRHRRSRTLPSPSPSSLATTGLLFLLLAQILLAVAAPPFGLARADGIPDLSVSSGDISFLPEIPEQAVPFAIRATVRNIGNATGSGTVKFYVGNLFTDWIAVREVNVSVDTGGAVSASVSLSLPAGIFRLTVQVINVAPTDGNWSNNIAFTTVEVSPALPDLAIYGTDLALSLGRPREGEPFIMYARVNNLGNANGSGIVEFYVDPAGTGGDAPIRAVNVSVASRNASVASISLTLALGLHTLEVRVVGVLPSDRYPANNIASLIVDVLSAESPEGRPLTLHLEGANITMRGGMNQPISLNVTAHNGRALGVVVIVVNSSGAFAEPLGLPVDIEDGQTAHLNLRIMAPERSGEWKITVQAVALNARSNKTPIFLHVSSSSSQSATSDGSAATVVTVVVVVGLLLGGVNSVERGRYRFLGLLLPLYTRLRKEGLLDQYTRGKIHGCILANPGEHFGAIAKALGVSASNLAYHLRVLERGGVVSSRKDGSLRRFYPRGVALPEAGDPKLTWVQMAIRDVVREAPDINQKGLASVLKLHPSTVNSHVKGLLERGIILASRKGMSIRYRLNSEVAASQIEEEATRSDLSAPTKSG